MNVRSWWLLPVVGNIPGFPASTVGAILVEVLRDLEQSRFCWMPLTARWKPVVNVPIRSEHGEKARPQLPALLGRRKGLSIANHDERVACSGQEDVETFRSKHEADITR